MIDVTINAVTVSGDISTSVFVILPKEIVDAPIKFKEIIYTAEYNEDASISLDKAIEIEGDSVDEVNIFGGITE